MWGDHFWAGFVVGAWLPWFLSRVAKYLIERKLRP